MADNNCDERVSEARKDAYHEGRQDGFYAGRRAGVWLAFNGPQAKAKARRIDVQAMRRQDVALEGLGDVFGRAEQERDAPPPRPAPAPAPRPAPAQDVFAPPAPRPDEIPELPLDEYEPDGYNEYTTQELRDRIALLRQQGRDSELNRLLKVVANRHKQDIRAMNRAVRARERQDREAAMNPRQRAAREQVRLQDEQQRRERQEYERERARLSALPGGLLRRDRLDREWRERNRALI